MEKFFYTVFFCGIFSTANTFLLPDQHEIIYDYHTETSASVIGNDDDTTDFTLNATLSLKTYDELTFGVLSNIQFDFIIGDDKLAAGIDSSKLKMDSLEKPFAIRYQPSGKIIEMLTDKDDELWSINFKKGIASLFQLDLKEMSKDDALLSGFSSDETSLNGQCPVSYSISQKDDKFEILKIIDSSTCLGQSWYKDSEFPLGKCEYNAMQPLTAISKRKYLVDKIKDDLVIECIKNENSLTASPVTGGNYIQLIWAEQNLKMVKKEKLNEAAAPSVEGMINKKLTANFFLDEDKKFDLSGGRLMTDPELMIDELKKDILELADFKKIYEIDDKSVVSKEGDLVGVIIRKMELLDEEQLKLVLEKLGENEEAIKVFYKLLSKVGTYSSMMFIKKYLMENPSYDKLPEGLLDYVAFSWKFPDVKVMKEYLVLLEPDSKLDEKMWDQVMLVVSSMLSKVSKEDEVQDGINFFIEGFKSADSEFKQMKFLAALKNINSKSTIKFLMSLVKGNKEMTPFIKNLAIWALKDMHATRPDMLDWLYLPLLSDVKENFLVRCSAMDVYLDKPTVAKVLKVSSIMEDEKDLNVLSAWRSRIKSLSESKLPCYKQEAEYAKELIDEFPDMSDLPQTSFQKIIDFYEKRLGISKMSSFIKSGNLYRDGYFTMLIDTIPDFTEVLDSKKSIFIRAKLNELKEEDKKNLYKDKKDYFVAILDDMLSCNKISWDFILLVDGKVVYISKELPLGPCETDEKFKKFLFSFSNLDKKIIVPTDVGLPAIFYAYKYTKDFVEASLLKYKDVWQTDFVLDFIAKTSVGYGMKFYNPAGNIYQGVMRHHLMNMELPLKFSKKDLKVEDLNIYKHLFFFNNTVDGKIKNQGFKSSVHSEVYVEDMSGLWKKGCAECKDYIKLSKGDKYKKEYPIIKFEFPGAEFELMLYDCETELSESKIAKMKAFILKELNKFGTPSGPKYFSMRAFYLKSFIMPISDMCSLKFLRKPSSVSTEYEFAYDFTNELFRTQLIEKKLLKEDGEYKGWSFLKNSTVLDDKKKREYVVFFKKNFGEDMSFKVEAKQEFDNFESIGEYKLLNEDLEDPTDIDIKVKAGNWDDKDINEKLMYDKCIKMESSLECVKKLTLLKNYEFEIKYKSLSKKFIKWFKVGIELFSTLYSDNLIYSDDMTRTDKGMVKILLKLKNLDKMDIRFISERFNVDFKDVPMDTLFFNMLPNFISSHFTKLGMFENEYKDLESCKIKVDYFKDINGKKVDKLLDENWVNFLSSCEEDEEKKLICQYEVFVQNREEVKLGLRIKTPEGELEAYNVGFDDDTDKDEIGVLWNKNVIKIDDSGYYFDDKIKVKLIDGPRMFLDVKGKMLVVDFTNKEINVHFEKEYLKEDQYGLCYSS